MLETTDRDLKSNANLVCLLLYMLLLKILASFFYQVRLNMQLAARTFRLAPVLHRTPMSVKRAKYLLGSQSN